MVTDNEKELSIFDDSVVNFAERLKQLEHLDKEEEKARQREKGSPFSRWTQFNNEHTKELMWLAWKHPKAHVILLFLIDQMDEYNAVMCSYRVLEELLGVGTATITRNIKILKDNGFIAILKSGTSNVYAINDKIYWKSWGSNRKYSKFPANVVLALSEQEAEEQIKFEGLGSTKNKVLHKNEVKHEENPTFEELEERALMLKKVQSKEHEDE